MVCDPPAGRAAEVLDVLDPKEQGKNGFGAFAERQSERRQAEGAPARPETAIAGEIAATPTPPVPVARSEAPRVPRPSLGVSGPEKAPAPAVNADGAIPAVADSVAAADFRMPLSRLYERFEKSVSGRSSGDHADVHSTILARLAENRRHAEAAGWSSLALERQGGLGRLNLVGFAPAASTRTIVPDWTAGVAAETLARRSDAARATAGLHVRSGMAVHPPRGPGRGR